MKKKAPVLSFIIGLLFILNVPTAAAAPDGQAYTPPIATSGSIDLQSIDWQNNSRVKLDGEWQFYYKNLLTPRTSPKH